MAYIKIEDLTFKYNDAKSYALSNINLDVQKGDFVLLCGKSGSGKSTLLKMLKREITPKGDKTGSINIDDLDINQLDSKSSASKIGFVQQNPDNQIVTDKVWHELAFGLENLAVTPSQIRLRVSEVSEFFGITKWYHKSTSELSGGQKQLLNLAAIMAMNPDILLLDEPISQLDPIASIEFLQSVRRINTELGVTVIMSSHHLEDIFAMSSKVVVMDSGAIQIDGTPATVAEKMQDMQNHAVYSGLPTPVRMYHGLDKGGVCPLNVKESREYIASHITKSKSRLMQQDQSGITSMENVIEVSNCYFRYNRNGRDIISGANFTVKKGIITAILGGNGAGKSTLLKAMAGVVKPYAGSINVCGKNIKSYKGSSLYKGLISMLPQDPTLLFSRSTVREELESAKPLRDDPQIIPNEQLTQLLDIEYIMDMNPHDISGGEAQKVAFAKILKLNPSILLLDEPTKGLDPSAKKVLADILLSLKGSGVTIVLVSHDVEFCSMYADICSMFFDGGIVSESDARGFFTANSYYTTASARIAKGFFDGVVTTSELIAMARHCI